MNLKLCFVSLITLTIAKAAPLSNSTDSTELSTTLTSTQKRYHILPLFTGDWLSTNMYCRLRGMRSINILTKEENDQIERIISDAGYVNTFFWTDGRRFDGRLHWFDSGKQMEFTSWNYGEPDNAGDCFVTRNGKWHADACHNAHHVICEEDVKH